MNSSSYPTTVCCYCHSNKRTSSNDGCDNPVKFVQIIQVFYYDNPRARVVQKDLCVLGCTTSGVVKG